MDNIILGRDIDCSGEDPHKQFMSRFESHAGLKSGEKPDRPFRKPCYAMTSTMDSVIWGRDFDRSGRPRTKCLATPTRVMQACMWVMRHPDHFARANMP